jgi:hypothetical protein
MMIDTSTGKYSNGFTTYSSARLCPSGGVGESVRQALQGEPRDFFNLDS